MPWNEMKLGKIYKVMGIYCLTFVFILAKLIWHRRNDVTRNRSMQCALTADWVSSQTTRRPHEKLILVWLTLLSGRRRNYWGKNIINNCNPLLHGAWLSPSQTILCFKSHHYWTHKSPPPPFHHWKGREQFASQAKKGLFVRVHDAQNDNVMSF